MYITFYITLQNLAEEELGKAMERSADEGVPGAKKVPPTPARRRLKPIGPFQGHQTYKEI